MSGGVMVCDSFGYNDLGNLVVVREIINSDYYCQILRDKLSESATKIGLKRSMLSLIQYNDPKHCANKTTKLFCYIKVRVLITHHKVLI